MGKAKEAWYVMGKFHTRLKYETLIGKARPHVHFVKVNIDRSVKGQLGQAAARGVLRDDGGSWISGFTFRVGISCIMIAELWVIYHGLLLCWE
ncbi:hypothetical protein REPUB_Repub01dG0059800 [Reevesia pubescens]